MQSKWWTMCLAGCALMFSALAFAGTDPDPITLGIADGATNIGDTVEILVTIDSGDTQPSTLVIFIAFDNTKLEPVGDAFEFTFTDDDGDPVLDSDGNAITFRSIVRPEAALQGRNKAIDTEVLDEGVLGIAIQGGTARIPDGPLLTATFRVLNGASPSEIIPLDGVDEDAPIPVTNDQGEVSVVFSSAAVSEDNGGGVQTISIPVTHADGSVEVGCVPVAETPQNVTASQGQPDAVTVSWNAVATPGAEYRVFRSPDQDISNASPLGAGWSTATFFSDITALAPLDGGAGCACNANPNVVNYYYWVRARTPQGCEGSFSAPPVLGFRGAAKAASAAAKTRAEFFPAGTTAGAVVSVALDDAVAMRVDGDRPGDALLFAGSAASLEIIAAGTDSWWVVAAPETAWEDGEIIEIHAGGQIRVYSADAALTATDAQKSVSVDFAGDAAPWLPEGVGEPYAVVPEGVLSEPLTVWLPVPDGAEADDLIVYAYHESNGARGWYYASNVDGLIKGDAQQRETSEGVEIGVTLRHGAIVQLGEAVAVNRPAAASVLPISFDRMLRANGGALLIGAVMVMVLLASRAAQGRVYQR